MMTYDICLKNRFHFAIVLSVFDAQMTSQRGKIKNVDDEAMSSGSPTLMFLQRWDVLCSSITEQTTGKWKLSLLYNKYKRFTKFS